MRSKFPFLTRTITQKLWWQHVWPFLQQEMKAAEVLAAVLQPALAMVQEATANEYEEFILPTFRYIYIQKSFLLIAASQTIE
jgi:SCY1-like protein 2